MAVPMTMEDDEFDPESFVLALGSADDSLVKRAVWRLQSRIGDPSFTDQFVSYGGLPRVRYLSTSANGNTLAYTLACLSTLLDLDQGWSYVDQDVIARLVQLVVGQPLVNILRGALVILAAIVSHPPSDDPNIASGVTSLGPAIEVNPTFLEMLVNRLSSADHTLCANSLQLINALMRDSVMNGTDKEWPIFVSRLKELGAIKSVYSLTQGSGLQDLAGPLLDFQTLMKILLRKWRDVPVDLDRPEHKRQMKHIYLAANPDRRRNRSEEQDGETQAKGRDPERWKRIGFETAHPADEFQESGFLGMLDLVDYIKASEEGFRRLLLEQSSIHIKERCPIAKASLAVSVILYDHFEIERPELDAEIHRAAGNYDKIFKPSLLQWPRLHTAGLQAFFRLWAATGAVAEDFSKIEELVRILFEQVVGSAARTQDIAEIEQELANFDLRELRKLQMDLLELTHEDVWGQHLKQIKDDLRHEALEFMKEQRIRCLLQGAWFPNLPSISKPSNAAPEAPADTRTPSWRFARLSNNRRYLHWADYDLKPTTDPALDAMPTKFSMSSVTAVRSEVTANDVDEVESVLSDDESGTTIRYQNKATLNGNRKKDRQTSTTTTILIQGSSQPKHSRNQSQGKTLSSVKSRKSSVDTNGTGNEVALLTLHPTTPSIAAEWVDGLLMLAGNAPIQPETNKLVSFISRYGLKIRMLNVRFGEGGVGAGLDEWGSAKEVELPGREGLDDDYFYDMPGAV